jgi:hypothetical protein
MDGVPHRRRPRRLLAAALLAVASLGLAACAATAPASTPAPWASTSASASQSAPAPASKSAAAATLPSPVASLAALSASHPCVGAPAPARWNHVVWIVMENKAAGDVLGSPSAPGETALAHACASASDYRAYTHPSLPNYLALTSGSAHGVRDDAGPAAHPISGPSLFSELAGAGSSWGVYAESMPSPCFGTAAGTYAVKHNPAVYYTDLRATCARYDVPLGTPSSGTFADGLRTGTLPAFSLVVPNTCNDTHDCPVATGDAWLTTWLRTILDSPTYRAGRTAVFVTWDEDDSSSGNRVALIAVAPSVRPGTVTAGAFGHLSLLHTTQQLLGLDPLLAPSAPSMRAALHL